MAVFKINIQNWVEYIPNASLEVPDSKRQPYSWTKTISTYYTAPAVIAATNCLTGYCLEIDGSLTGTDKVYFGHTDGTTPFFANVDSSRGCTIEFQAKAISFGSTYGHVIRMTNGSYLDQLLFYSNRISVSEVGKTYPMDVTDNFHTYRLLMQENRVSCYVDSVLRISGTTPTTTTLRETTFGDYSASANRGGKIQYGYFRYSTDGAFPPEEDFKAGWCYSDLDIQDRRNISEKNIIRSDNSIIPEGKMQAVKIKVSGTVVGSCWPSFRNTLRRLKCLLNSGTQKIRMDDERYIEGIHEGFTLKPVMQKYAEFNAGFICRYPYWQQGWASYFSTAPVSAETFYLTNNSDIEIPCKIILTGAAAATVHNNVAFYNLTTNQQGKFTGDLLATAELILDKGFNEYNKYQILVGTAQSYGSYEGDLFTLAPGKNKLVYVGAAIGTIELYWREAFHL